MRSPTRTWTEAAAATSRKRPAPPTGPGSRWTRSAVGSSGAPSTARSNLRRSTAAAPRNSVSSARQPRNPCGRLRSIPTNRVFWANEQVKSAISFANLSGGGGDMPTAGANLKFPDGVAILRRPAGTAPPTISSPRLMASTLSCSQGAWAGDAPASLFYRAPHSVRLPVAAERQPRSPDPPNRASKAASGGRLRLPGDGDQCRRLDHADQQGAVRLLPARPVGDRGPDSPGQERQGAAAV